MFLETYRRNIFVLERKIVFLRRICVSLKAVVLEKKNIIGRFYLSGGNGNLVGIFCSRKEIRRFYSLKEIVFRYFASISE